MKNGIPATDAQKAGKWPQNYRTGGCQKVMEQKPVTPLTYQKDVTIEQMRPDRYRDNIGK